MDVEILARLQFAFTIMFHYIYPPLSIGLGVVIVIVEGMYLYTNDQRYLKMAKYWVKIFALTFALGVVTGIVMEFEFGTNWATYSRYVGDVFGSALAAEGVFAFFLESGFLALLLFGWDRIGKVMHFISSLMVCLGAHFSAVWIVVANSWMQTPAGFKIAGEGLNARAEIIDFSAMVFNPSSVIRLSHTLVGAWLAGAFLVISISAFYLVKGRYPDFAKRSIGVGLTLALISCMLQLWLGSESAEIVTKYQPYKLAAFEGVFQTTTQAPYHLLGLVNIDEKKIDYALSVPGLLSYMATGSTAGEVIGLDQIPSKDWPHVKTLFLSYRLMIATWFLMFFIAVIGFYKLWKGTLINSKPILWCMVFSVLLPQVGNQVGWLCAEMGRYPWIVQGQLRIADGLSKAVTAGHVLGSIITFGLVYLLLFILFIYLLDQKIKQGPGEEEEESLYHSKQYIWSKSHGN